MSHLKMTPEEVAAHYARIGKQKPSCLHRDTVRKGRATSVCVDCGEDVTIHEVLMQEVKQPYAPYKTKSEHIYAQILRERGIPPELAYECIKFKVGVGRWYCPDFVYRLGNKTIVAEVKAHHRFAEKGINKLRAAAMFFPDYEWQLVVFDKGAWTVEIIK